MESEKELMMGFVDSCYRIYNSSLYAYLLLVRMTRFFGSFGKLFKYLLFFFLRQGDALKTRYGTWAGDSFCLLFGRHPRPCRTCWRACHDMPEIRGCRFIYLPRCGLSN